MGISHGGVSINDFTISTVTGALSTFLHTSDTDSAAIRTPMLNTFHKPHAS